MPSVPAPSASRSPLRLARGGAAATVATAVALAGHVIGGGEVPVLLGVIVPWWLSVMLCTLLAGTRFSMPRMGAAVLGSQLLLHHLFMLGTPSHHPVTMVNTPGMHLDHGAHMSADAAAPVTSTTDTTAPAGTSMDAAAPMADMASMHSSAQMLLWHALAALVTTLLLQRGEAFTLQGLAMAEHLLRFLWRPRTIAHRPILQAGPRLPLPQVEDLRHAQRTLLSPQLLRGPPLEPLPVA